MPKPQTPEFLAPDLLDRLRDRFRPFPLTERWGVEILEVGPGTARMRLQANAYTCNPGGGPVNGGIQATLADMACAMALCTAFDGAMPFVTSDLHIRYLEAADGALEAEAAVVRRTARSAVIECRLRVGAVVVALCTSHFAIHPKHLP